MYLANAYAARVHTINWAIKIDETVKVNIGEASYKLHSFNLGSSTNTIGILEECLILDKYALFYFPQKKLVIFLIELFSLRA